MKTVERFC